MDKKKIICDTDVMIDYLDRRNPRHLATKSILENQIGIENIFISAITKMELMSGAINKADLERINNELLQVPSLLINYEITLTALDLLHKYILSHRLSLADCLIASTSITTNTELFTYNTKDFKFISQLALYK